MIKKRPLKSALQDVMTTALAASLTKAESSFDNDHTVMHAESREELDEINAMISAQMPWESRHALSHQLKFSDTDNITLLDEFAFWQGRLHHPGRCSNSTRT